ncbi:triose-phosphate isomerase [Asaia krungthepensis]|uniref:Triosephosphate isomerase n=1 Tax=Asaia krungthepensis NRIC 0535 TaxID=1307925 RepID=A0ABQ0PXT5_9PROT|nr:triose-phosphate isomerase [Asaia krungthepensis]GBQ84236.1 triosephosphate isomerase [Asaia krungthepensis NRIC 0535]
MRQMIIGNWKMHGLRGDGKELAQEIAAAIGPALTRRDVVLAPPFTLTHCLAPLLHEHGIGLGAQDCHAEAEGAYTGDISAAMLADLGVSHVILGHSERREHHHETNARIRRKAERAREFGLCPVVCVGESARQKEDGHAEPWLTEQITQSLPADFDGIVAYEPIWAIGTGKAATQEDIESRMVFLHGVLADHLETDDKPTRVLYGGSVKPEDAASILAVPGVGGVLVGGASLSARSFLGIVQAGLSSAS